MTNAIQWLNCNQSLETSPMGRPLNTSGKIARFCTIDRASFGPKATALVIQAVAAAVFALPFVALGVTGLFAITAVAYSAPVVGTAAFLGFIVLIAGFGAKDALYDYLYREIANEFEVQEEENAVINALGGTDAFAGLPRLTPEDVSRIHGGTAEIPWRHKLVRFKTTDVNAPITVGLDVLNRPFVCLRVKSTLPDVEVNGGRPYVKTVFMTKSSPIIGNSWEYGSNYDKEEYFHFGAHVNASRMVENLVKKPNPHEQLVVNV